METTNQNNEVADLLYKEKYLQAGETFEEGMNRIAGALCDGKEHFRKLQDILMSKRFLPAGRVQASVGAIRETTPYNCYVSGIINDDSDDIMDKAKEAFQTMRLGGGIGYDFSTIRPCGDRIHSLDSHSSGPVGNDKIDTGFMDIYDAVCKTVMSAGHRRGAQMGVMRVDHPDVFHFIRAKRKPGRLTNFNVSVGVTNEFMEALKADSSFDLKFEGKRYATVRASNMWDEIMRSTWDYAEPGVLFLDRMNKKNNLWYREKLTATNPCGEQPLPPYGACLLGSFNLTAYVYSKVEHDEQLGRSTVEYYFDKEQFKHDIPYVVRAMDNIIDIATYPLPQQEERAKGDRRMGLGITGFANASEALGFRYGSSLSNMLLKSILKTLNESAYLSSVELAIEKGYFPTFDKWLYASDEDSFASKLPESIKYDIHVHGIRNSHLTSIAPTGSISLAAGNVSSGIEPPYTKGKYSRNVATAGGGKETFVMEDWLEANTGMSGRTADEVRLSEHVEVLGFASRGVDSAVSKTCNVGPDVTFEEFKDVYVQAYDVGASGITTYRPVEYGGKREGIMTKENPSPESIEQGAACFIDEYGNRSCE